LKIHHVRKDLSSLTDGENFIQTGKAGKPIFLRRRRVCIPSSNSLAIGKITGKNLRRMKTFLPIALAVVSILLGVALFLTKQSDNAELATSAGIAADFSNRLDTAQSQIIVREGTILTLSNSLAASTTAVTAVSNQLTEAQTRIGQQEKKVSELTQQLDALTTAASDKDALVLAMTNQISALTTQITKTEANIAQAKHDLTQARSDYAQLQNRLQRDVAERLVVERKFNNLSEVQAQAEKLKSNAGKNITTESIYAGLDIIIKSNGVAHVIAPD
jgi:septal ring factor EnvC (AmiA/AmiB activator)